MEGIPILETLAHRMLWSFLILVTILLIQNKLSTTIRTTGSLKIWSIHTLSATCLMGNWLIYVWATQNDRILEGALGYYINPFLYILLGSIFLGEKHSRLQMSAIAVAAAGVALQFPAVQGIPWAAFGLASTFAAYGIIRKKSPLGSFDGLTLETCIMLVPALIYISITHQHNQAFGNDTLSTCLLIATGAATIAPLLFFARATKSISLTQLGILQFIAPTGQLAVGWLVYHEPMPTLRLLSFALIWLAVAIYTFSLRKQA